jgi:hypothetical protein
MRHLATAFLALVALSVPGAAHGSFVTTWQAMYPNSTTDDHVLNGAGSSCQVCHWGPNGGPAWNAYGWSVRENINAGDSLTDAITHAESANPDADPVGAASLIEIGGGTQPGWTPGPNNTQYTPTSQNPGLDPPAAILGSLDPGSALLVYCSPGSAGVSACPCGNAPSAAGLGCNNSDNTGGAWIDAAGSPSLSTDTIVLTTGGQKSSATSVLLQGSSSNPSGVVFGQGVRCVAGALKRLYVRPALGGSVSLPAAGDASISARSAALGDPLPAGARREYMVYYRDPTVLGGCAATSTFNATSSGTLIWLP